jgi:hypothetical protein
VEELVMQMECKVDESDTLKPFLAELQEKFDAFEEFRKLFQKWQLGLDAVLKKVGVFDKHVQLHMQTS